MAWEGADGDVAWSADIAVRLREAKLLSEAKEDAITSAKTEKDPIVF